MADFSIRLADVRDVPGIEALIRRAYSKYLDRLGREPAPMLADYRQLVADGDTWVLEWEGALGGMVVLRAHPDHLLIGNVAVDPTQQGRGLGKRLLAFAERQARRRGLDEMRLFTNVLMHENLAIYSRLGWEEYDRGEQNGYLRVFMRKPVADA